ncbi:DNA-binding transcriptional LysR family regulator [Pelomonas saccharophila]|uniref:DNA-binding transcriptional LysR family regulator n=2 Tax=Roseateles saccharophilus TaxID=304 RepID=A0ABU1YW41_ROSSA|nr:DNA-binding transcriptional LysR family regulator [Roseateles saccharophilus]
MVSAHMQRLEREVGASLLLRTTRSLRLTEAGEGFYESTRQIVADAEAAIAAAAGDTAAPRGRLRVTAPVDYAERVLAPVAVALRQRHAELQIEVLAVDRPLDLVAEQIDVAVRIGELADSELRGTRVGRFGKCIVASPDLLAGRPAPARPEDLATLPFVALSVLAQPLSFTFSAAGEAEQTVRFQVALAMNTASAVRSAALAGGGLCVLPDYLVADDLAAGRLVALLPGWCLPEGGIHALYPAARQPPRKTRVLIEALQARAEQP